MKRWRLALLLVLAASTWVFAQTATSQAPPTSDNYSGMYSFLKDGEFVQITLEDAGRVTGFVSRYGDGESDRGAFLDQFFKQGKIDGPSINFMTETVHAVWYEFQGLFERGSGKTPADEAYYVLKGTLTEYREDADKKRSSKSREVLFKSFPQDMATAPSPRN
jgi:hypothetical protein